MAALKTLGLKSRSTREVEEAPEATKEVTTEVAIEAATEVNTRIAKEATKKAAVEVLTVVIRLSLHKMTIPGHHRVTNAKHLKSLMNGTLRE